MSANRLHEYDEWAEQVYLAEILMQCGVALRARDEIEGHVRGKFGQAPDHLGLAMAHQSFLGATAAISRFVSPSGKDAYKVARGAALTHRLAITLDSPILDREVRNGIEHMDEDLDEWLAVQPRPTADEIESGTMPRPPDRPPMPVRVIGPGLRISCRGRVVDVEAVAAEVRRIADLIPGEPDGAPLLTLLRRLAPFPKELQFGAPTRRPDEPVTAGIRSDDEVSGDGSPRDV